MSSSLKQYSVQQFIKLLKYRTVSQEGPLGQYEQCAQFLNDYCLKLGLQSQILRPVAGKPIVFSRWEGSNKTKKHILLNSHYDVVPAENLKWKTDPFEPVIIDGCIFARGTQDMKCVVIQYLLAIERLINSGVKPERTVDLSFVPDEEIGGIDGIKQLIDSKLFDMNNYEVALDEGLANEANFFTIFYGERTPYWFTVTAKGNVGHGSQFIQETAIEKLVKMINKALNFRKEQEQNLHYTHDGCKHAQAKQLGDVTTINLTMLKAGNSQDDKYTLNVIPSEAIAGFDLRVSPLMKMSDMRDLLDQWCSEEGVTWTNYIHSKDSEHHISETQNNIFYDKICEVVQSFGIGVEKAIFPAATDSRFLREIKIPAFGFSPMRNSKILLHCHDEHIKEEVFLEGIDVFEKIIFELQKL